VEGAQAEPVSVVEPKVSLPQDLHHAVTPLDPKVEMDNPVPQDSPDSLALRAVLVYVEIPPVQMVEMAEMAEMVGVVETEPMA
jgi:hypothetical protein